MKSTSLAVAAFLSVSLAWALPASAAVSSTFLIESGYACNTGRAVISGDYVAYSWGQPAGSYSLHVWNRATDEWITPAGTNSPRAISGDTLLVARPVSGQPGLFAKSLSNPAVETFVANGMLADMSGDLVVWQTEAFPGSQIRGKHLSGGTEFAISSGQWCENARISGNFAVWKSNGGLMPMGLFYKNLDTGTETLLSKTGWDLDVDGNTAVWSENFDGVPAIVARDLLSGETFTFSAGPGVLSRHQATISGTKVVWREFINSGRQTIMGADLLTGQEFVVDDSPGAAFLPAIDGNLVTWVKPVSSQDQALYGRMIPEPATLSLLALGGLCLLRRRK